MKVASSERYSLVFDKILETITSVLIQLFCVFCGFLSAKVSVLGGMFPFGLGFVAGANKDYIVASGIGVFFAHIIGSFSGGEFKYVAAVFAIVCIRLIIFGIKNISQNPAFCATIGFLATAITGIVAAKNSFFPEGILDVCESLIVASQAYFLSKVCLFNYGAKRGFSAEDLTAFVITVNILLVGFYSFKIGDLSIGKTAATLLVFCAVRFGRIMSGAVCGILTGLTMMLAGADIQIAFLYCVGGLVAGMLAPLGRIASVISFFSVTLFFATISNFSQESTSMLLSVVCGSIVFLLLPKKAFIRIGSLLTPPANTGGFNGLRKALVLRLGFASEALKGVSQTVEQVSEKLSERRMPDFNDVIKMVEREACTGCTFCINCWETNRNETIDAMVELTAAIKRNEPMEIANVPQGFSERCLRRERVETSLYQNYLEYTSLLKAEERIKEMREVVSDQFYGISDMLKDLSDEFDKSQKYDMEKAQGVVAALKSLDIRATECSCSIDKYGRMTLEVRLSEKPTLPFNRARVLSVLEEVCERQFEPPMINNSGQQYMITVSERAVFTADCGIAKYSCKNNSLSGDSAESFFDGKGHLVMVLSDGMGCGGRAAVDAAMAQGLMSKLIKSGFGYDCSLRIVNSAMLFKSTDESLATVDITTIDLFTGQTEMLKAGAAPTIVRRSGKTGRAQCKSLPIGILREVGFDRATITLNENDIAVMMSDGATSNGTDWICAELESWQDGTASQLAEHLACCARRRRTDGHEDDITVMVSIIQKAI